MLKFLSPLKMVHLRERAQAIAEFAIALPILMMMLVGIMEVGRMVLMYASVTSASREASRYASAVGLADGGTYYKYQYCEKIREVAKRSALVMSLPDSAITIEYDKGPGTTVHATCPVGAVANTSIPYASGDRVTVEVTLIYKPMVNLIPIGPQTIISTSSRTILGIMKLDYP